MNKKLILFGVLALAAYAALTAYKGKTVDEQKAEIQQEITTQLETYRQERIQACTDSIMSAAETRFAAMMAEKAAAATPGGVKRAVKKSGPRVDPLPQGNAPTDSKSKWDQNSPTGTKESQTKWQKATDPEGKKQEQPPAEQESKSKWKKSGGGN